MTPETLLSRVQAYCAHTPRIESLLLVGSRARGTARPDSDIDLVLVAATPAALAHDPQFAARFGPVARQQVEAYGACTSLRAWYTDGPEVEFGFVAPSWAALPLDAGTARVLRDGYRLLADPGGHFAGVGIPPLCPTGKEAAPWSS